MTTLEGELRSREIEQLLVAGLAGEVCTQASVLAGRERDFAVQLHPEGIRYLSSEGRRQLAYKSGPLGYLRRSIGASAPVH